MRRCGIWLAAALGAGAPAVQAQSVSTTLVEPAALEYPGNELAGQGVFVEVLEMLRSSDAVVPALPSDIHPIRTVYNREAIIPPQCYTRTEGRHNPCYVCHQDPIDGRENRMTDGELQKEYSFSDVGMTNHWLNLFEDRSERVAEITDEEILAWIDSDNYTELAPRLEAAGFEGWIPDLAGLEAGAAAFDAEGFARDGSRWVAFNYKPLPSTFWPTNGSTDDVMIRLPEVFSNDSNGEYSRDVYKANLAILEANLKGLAEVTVNAVDEAAVGADIDGDGRLGTAGRVSKVRSFVGAAKGYFFQPSLYPLGTEFLHTVRYVGLDDSDRISVSRRMKEVRYMQKTYMPPQDQLNELYREEGYEKDQGYLPGYINRGQRGFDNEMGWEIQGFIEDRSGRLRANTFEENLFCMGCHTSVGTTIDKTFSFPRKVDGAGGWGYIDLEGMPDAPNLGETAGEIATYFERAGGGGEFRSNEEMYARWFTADGRVDRERVAAARDVYDLITPSRERALLLNKAYRVLVEEQDFIFGRDATVVPPVNVYRRIDNETSPTLPASAIYRWDIRLDWSAAQ